MRDLLFNLQSLIDSDQFLSSLEPDTIDDLLDARDIDPFDADWGRVYDALKPQNLPDDAAVIALHEAAFKRAYAITNHPEACGYISDDFGLLADVLRAGLTDPWATSLFSSYCSGTLPHGELERDSRPLSEAVAQFKQ